MKKVAAVLFALMFVLLLAEAGQAQCSRAKRMVVRTLEGTAGGVLTGAIVGGRKDAEAFAGIGAGAGFATAIPTPAGCRTQKSSDIQYPDPNKGIVLSDAQKKQVEYAKKHHQPIPNFTVSTVPVTAAATPAPAQTSTTPVAPQSEARYSTPVKPTRKVWIRNIRGQANPEVLSAIIRRPLYDHGYATFDPTQSPDPKDPDVYFMDILVSQDTQGYTNQFSNVSGPRGSIFNNPSAGAATFFVSVSVYRAGEWVPELSFDRHPFQGTLVGLNQQISTRIRDVNLQTGGTTQVYSVDPGTAAAVRAIYQSLGL